MGAEARNIVALAGYLGAQAQDARQTIFAVSAVQLSSLIAKLFRAWFGKSLQQSHDGALPILRKRAHCFQRQVEHNRKTFVATTYQRPLFARRSR